MHVPGEKAELHLKSKAVGRVTVRGGDTSWGFGDFQPLDAFAEFAPLFGQWSILMHADEGEKLSDEASEELRALECQLDSLRARLFFPARNQWWEIAQVNIDGPLIEWKCY